MVVISGADFGTDGGTVTIGGIEIEICTWLDGAVEVTVHGGASNGLQEVVCAQTVVPPPLRWRSVRGTLGNRMTGTVNALTVRSDLRAGSYGAVMDLEVSDNRVALASAR